MAEPRETPWNRVVQKPPPYMRSFEFNAKPWGSEFRSRRQELDKYEQGRAIGAVERSPDLEERLMKRRTRQQQNAERRMQQEQES